MDTTTIRATIESKRLPEDNQNTPEWTTQVMTGEYDVPRGSTAALAEKIVAVIEEHAATE